MMRKESLEAVGLPGPPRQGEVGRFCACDHPYTKWMLNMLRGGASFRISTMLKERPQLFRQTYQVPDCPDLLCHDPHDDTPMFHRHAVLFLNPLCLAIYMRRHKCADLILKSGLNSASDKCWASHIFSRSQTSGGDLLQIYPVCIAIRREYFDVVPLLLQWAPTSLGQPITSSFGQPITSSLGQPITSSLGQPITSSIGQSITIVQRFNLMDKIELRYESRDVHKEYHYRDTLQYAIDTLKKRGNLPLFRLLEVFIIDCPEYFNANKMERDKQGNFFSLFYRIARVAYFEDPDCRIVMQLLQCLEILLRHRCTPWNNMTYESSHQSPGVDHSALIRDYNACVTLLFAIYHQIQLRVKNGPLDNLGYLIMKTLQQTQLRDRFLAMTPEQLQFKFGKITSVVSVPLEVVSVIKRHIQAIMELEKEREFKLNTVSKFKGVAHLNKNHRRSCSLKEPYEDTNLKNLLQSRIIAPINTSGFIGKCPTLTNSQKQYPDQQLMDENIPIYSYQTGSANCYTQTTNSLARSGRESCRNEYQPSQSDHNMKAIQCRSNTIPGLKKKSQEMSTKTRNLEQFVFHDPTDENSEVSESSHVLNCIEMTPMRACTRLQMENKQCKVQPNGDINRNHNNASRSNNNSNQSDTQLHTNFLLSTQPRQSSRNNVQNYNNVECEESLMQTVDEEYDFSAEFTDNNKLREFEDDLFNELFYEYNKEKGRYPFDYENNDLLKI